MNKIVHLNVESITVVIYKDVFSLHDKSISLDVSYLFIYLWLCRVLVATHRIFVAVCGLLSSCGARAPERVGSVVCGRQAL